MSADTDRRKDRPPQKRTTAKTDRSEIVPYLGSSSDYIREAHTNHPQSSGRPDGS